MQGAKGVIISIIGGDDMKLLEVDEAANHIRELVDPNANIIWGSAFNPDLNGKIRVSVVATGIEQSVEQAEQAARPVNLPGAARGPAFTPAATPRPAIATPTAAPVTPPPAAVTPPPAAPAPAAPPAQAWAPQPEAAPPADDPLDLTFDLGADPAQDYTIDPAPAAPTPRLGLGAGAEPERPAPRVGGGAGGSTLFERMANLSRGAARTEDAEEGEDSASLSIPRFLGRQNNQ
jgi:cell division protein FtsZ